MRPHSRLTRTWRWGLTRIVCYPIIAAGTVFCVIGFTVPEVLTSEYREGIRVERVDMDPAHVCDWCNEPLGPAGG